MRLIGSAFLIGTAAAGSGGLRLKGPNNAWATMGYDSATGLNVKASKCVHRANWCAPYNASSCPASSWPVASSVRINGDDASSAVIQLHEDGTLAFADKICVQASTAFDYVPPTEGIKLNGSSGKDATFITAVSSGIVLVSAPGIFVNGESINPVCVCTGGVAATFNAGAQTSAPTTPAPTLAKVAFLNPYPKYDEFNKRIMNCGKGKCCTGGGCKPGMCCQTAEGDTRSTVSKFCGGNSCLRHAGCESECPPAFPFFRLVHPGPRNRWTGNRTLSSECLAN